MRVWGLPALSSGLKRLEFEIERFPLRSRRNHGPLNASGRYAEADWGIERSELILVHPQIFQGAYRHTSLYT